MIVTIQTNIFTVTLFPTHFGVLRRTRGRGERASYIKQLEQNKLARDREFQSKLNNVGKGVGGNTVTSTFNMDPYRSSASSGSTRDRLSMLKMRFDHVLG